MTKIPLSDLFTIKYGNSFDLTQLEVCDATYQNKVNYVSRTEKNNGVSAIVKQIDAAEPFPSGLITVAGSGNSVLESNIQTEPFYTGYHVFILKEKRPLTDLEKLFYCHCIRRNRYRYSFGRQANRTLSKILIPDQMPVNFGKIDLECIVNISKNPIVPELLDIDTSNWKYFKYGGNNGIFTIKNGYYNKKPDHTKDGRIPFIGSSEFNNGVTEFYSLFDIENNNKDENSGFHTVDQKIFKGNCITVSNNGSVGNAFYQPIDFTCSHDVNVLLLRERNWNKYLAMFICTVIKLEKYRWSYGRKWRPKRMPDSNIKLPVDKNGNPNWDFMERYIKSLSYASSI